MFRNEAFTTELPVGQTGNQSGNKKTPGNNRVWRCELSRHNGHSKSGVQEKVHSNVGIH